MAVDSLVAEARRALHAGRWQEARAAYERLLADDPSAEALDGLGEALWWLGDPGASVRLRERAYTAFRRAGDRPAALRTAVSVCLTYRADFGNRAAAHGWVARAARLLGDGGDQALEGWVHLLRAGEAADPARAESLAERALAAARQGADVDLELCALSEVGRARIARGQRESGFALLDEAMAGALAGEWTNPETVVYASCHMLGACAAVADLERARQWCAAADRFLDEYGCPFLFVFCRIQYGAVLLDTGRWADAERELEAALRVSASTYPVMAAHATARLALLFVRRGRLEEAERLLSSLADRGSATQADAELLLARSAPADAAAILDRRLQELPSAAPAAAALLALLVDARLRAGDAAGAAAAAARLAEPSQPDERAVASAQLAAGRLAWAEGREEDAAGALAGAADLFAQAGLPFEAAGARLELARALAARHPGLAAAEGRSALSGFERLGAGTHADAAAALLRSLGVAGRRAPRTGAVLTRREQEVLELLAAGLSNPEIAQRLVISRKTAAHHVSSVLAKLGVRNRVEAVAYAARHGHGPAG